MGFIWYNNISSGVYLIPNQLLEIQQKIDYVEENPGCQSHNVTYLATHYTEVLNTHLTTNSMLLAYYRYYGPIRWPESMIS